jgi:hypothetical protein
MKVLSRGLLIAAILALAVGLGFAQAQSGTYYVASNGSDSNPGTEAHPFRTINHGVSVLEAGDTLYIRKGIYHEQVRITRSGTASSPIRVAAYPTETPVIDGRNNIPSGWGYLLQISGDHIIVEGLEVRNSASVGVGLAGQYGVVRDLYVHHSYDGGILVTGPHNTIEDSEAYWNSTKREYGNGSGYWSWGMSAVNTNDVTFRGNHVHQNWGEGIGPFQCDDIVIEDNVSYDNFSGNIYLNRINGALVQRNLVYGIPGSAIETGAGRAIPGISLADEGTAELASITVVNNVVYNTSNAGIYFWHGASGSGLKNSLIANNTSIVPRDYGLSVHSGSHSNTRIINNILSESYVTPSSGLHLEHNLWTEGAPGNGAGAGDVTGDPQFVDAEARDFHLEVSSPAIDAGATLTNVDVDNEGASRPQGNSWDIGAYEYTDGAPQPTGTPTPQATDTPMPQPTNTPDPTQTPDGDTIIVTINGDTTLTATFEQIEYDVTTSIEGEGAVSISSEGPYHNGETVTLTATPAKGWEFVGWEGDVPSIDNPLTITVEDNVTLTAVFEQVEYTLSVEIVGQGSVVKVPDLSGYYYGRVVTLTAFAEDGWVFTGWSED